nr:zinc metallopeptidase [Tissierella sp.]
MYRGLAGYSGSSWMLFVLPAMLLAFFAQMKIKNAYQKYSKISSGTNLTGFEIARKILDKNGLTDVAIERSPGVLSDHYDPRSRILRLSDGIYKGNSVASMSVAAHEVGHAIQHSEGYFPLILRNNIAPLVSFATRFVWIFIFLGIIVSSYFIDIGIIMFLSIVAFQVVTLPVEFNASKRALLELEDGIAPRESISPAKSMLNAAAFTYVAATLVAVAQLLRLLSMSNRRR